MRRVMKCNFKNNELLTQKHVEFAPNIYLKIGKIHELCGPAKIRMAILIGAKTKGLIAWIRPDWEEFIINADSISYWFSPNQLLFINAKNKNDLFFATEEVLRSGISEVTITELPKIPSSLHMRRINFALNSGFKSKTAKNPLSLILSPNRGGLTSVESRWYASNLPCWKNLTDKDLSELKYKWYLKRTFSKTDPVKEWVIKTNTPRKKGGRPELLSLPMT